MGVAWWCSVLDVNEVDEVCEGEQREGLTSRPALSPCNERGALADLRTLLAEKVG